MATPLIPISRAWSMMDFQGVTYRLIWSRRQISASPQYPPPTCVQFGCLKRGLLQSFLMNPEKQRVCTCTLLFWWLSHRSAFFARDLSWLVFSLPPRRTISTRALAMIHTHSVLQPFLIIASCTVIKSHSFFSSTPFPKGFIWPGTTAPLYSQSRLALIHFPKQRL